MKQIIPAKWIIFLFCNILFVIVDKATCDRSILETTVVTETNEEIPLRWVETDPLLANDNLPIWETIDASYMKLNLKVMKELGKFRTFHDLEKSSAVVLIEQWNCIYGVIDVRYTIVCLPLEQLHGHQHKIGESPNLMTANYQIYPNHGQVMESSGVPLADDVASTSDDTSNEFRMLIKTYVNPDKLIPHDRPMCSKSRVDKTMGRLKESHDGPPQKKHRPNIPWSYEEQVITVYPEILVLISHEMISHTSYLITTVVRYIVQLNAVAMLFAKLASHDIRIHINIAGLVIESNPNTFVSESLFDNDHPSGDTVLNSVTEFVRDSKLRQSGLRRALSEDSFDMFLLFTTNEWLERAVNPGGFSTQVYDIKNMRKQRNNVKKVLGSVVDATDIMHYYVNAAREIAHLMTVEDDDDQCVGEQCHTIMHASNQYCPNCLTWSKQSVKSFMKYLSANTNRCFLRNLPRSLYPYDRPYKTLIPADQCFCYGYGPHMESTHLDSEPVYHMCKRKLQCAASEYSMRLMTVTTIIDGTPCNKHDDSEVCWRGSCISMDPSRHH